MVKHGRHAPVPFGYIAERTGEQSEAVMEFRGHGRAGHVAQPTRRQFDGQWQPCYALANIGNGFCLHGRWCKMGQYLLRRLLE